MFSRLILLFGLLITSSAFASMSTNQYNPTGFNQHKSYILEAAHISGMDMGLITAIASRESGLGKKVKGPGSAGGVMQTVNRTWVYERSKHHQKAGVAKNVSVYNARANIIISALAMAEDRDYLRAKTNKNITNGDVYMARFVGRYGAKAILNGDPNAPISRYVKIHPGNGNMYKVNGKIATVKQFRAKMDGLIKEQKIAYRTDIQQAKLDYLVEHIVNGKDPKNALLAMR